MIAGPQEIGDLTGLKEILEKLKDAPSKKTMEEILHTLPPKSIVTINTQNSIHIFRIEGHYVAEFPEGYKPEGTEDDHYKKGSMPGTAIMMLTSTNTDVSPGLLRYIALNEKISIAQNVKFMFGGGNLGTPVSIEVVDPEYTEGVEPVFRKVEEEEVEENASATEA